MGVSDKKNDDPRHRGLSGEVKYRLFFTYDKLRTGIRPCQDPRLNTVLGARTTQRPSENNVLTKYYGFIYSTLVNAFTTKRPRLFLPCQIYFLRHGSVFKFSNTY